MLNILSLAEHLIEEKLAPIVLTLVGLIDNLTGSTLGHAIDTTLFISGLGALGVHIAGLSTPTPSSPSSAKS